MVSVGGCSPEEDGACVRVVPGLKVGPEPASAADKLFVTVSISVVQGPALAELAIHDNSAKLASMRIGWFITSSFRQVARRKRRFRKAVPDALLCGTAARGLHGSQLGRRRSTSSGGFFSFRVGAAEAALLDPAPDTSH